MSTSCTLARERASIQCHLVPIHIVRILTYYFSPSTILDNSRYPDRVTKLPFSSDSPTPTGPLSGMSLKLGDSDTPSHSVPASPTFTSEIFRAVANVLRPSESLRGLRTSRRSRRRSQINPCHAPTTMRYKPSKGASNIQS